RALAALSRQAEGADRKNPSARYEDLVLEVALALSWSESMTHDRMSVARELDERLPQAWQGLAEGRLNFAKAREIAKGAEKLADDDHAAELERRVLAEVDDL